MRIKLDENLSRYLQQDLAAEGHQSSTAADEGLLGRTDAELGSAAAGKGMMVSRSTWSSAIRASIQPVPMRGWSCSDLAPWAPGP